MAKATARNDVHCGNGRAEKPGSLAIPEWPKADQKAWHDACRPGGHFRRGGAAAHLGQVSRADIASRYGMFLDFLQRSGVLDLVAAPAMQTTSENVAAYVAELQGRVRSVTIWNCIYKLRRASELMAPNIDFSWLAEIEKDLALTMQPRSKYERLVLSQRLVEAGLTLVAEAEMSDGALVGRAKRVRDGTMIALLALCPIRLKNFTALEIGSTFREIESAWWISLPGRTTKSRTPLERRVPSFLKPTIDTYINNYRPALVRPSQPSNSLWLSSTSGQRMLAPNLSTLMSKITWETIGVAVSPHLFRTAAASTASVYCNNMPLVRALVVICVVRNG